MPPPVLTLSVPADERLRGLVADVVRAWFALTGRASSATDRFVDSLAAAVTRIAVVAQLARRRIHVDPLDEVAVAIETTDAGVDVQISSGDRHETLSCSSTTP